MSSEEERLKKLEGEKRHREFIEECAMRHADEVVHAMRKIDLYAAMAMQGMLSNPEASRLSPSEISSLAFDHAYALCITLSENL